MSHEDDSGARHLPTEKEIKRICRDEIQPTWTEREKRKRGGGDGVVHWKLPVVKLGDLPENVQSMIESINKENENGDHKSEAVVRR